MCALSRWNGEGAFPCAKSNHSGWDRECRAASFAGRQLACALDRSIAQRLAVKQTIGGERGERQMPATEPKQKDTTERSTKSVKDSNGRPSFVRLDLTAEQKDAMSQWSEELSDRELLTLYVECQSDGYVYSAKSLDQGYQASLTPAYGSADRSNGGKCLVTRASTPERAMYSLFFKHVELMHKNWSSLNTATELEW